MIKSNLPTIASPKDVTTLVGAKTISTVQVYKHGTVNVVELVFTDATTQFIKLSTNVGLEIGGTAEMGTGTKVGW